METESIERATKMLEAITSEPKSLAGHTLEISYAKSVVDPPSTDLYIHMSDPALPADELRALFGEFESSITDVRQRALRSSIPVLKLSHSTSAPVFS